MRVRDDGTGSGLCSTVLGSGINCAESSGSADTEREREREG
jgi:hypothetical protein